MLHFAAYHNAEGCMIYLDNAATSAFKPKGVGEAVAYDPVSYTHLTLPTTERV